VGIGWRRIENTTAMVYDMHFREAVPEDEFVFALSQVFMIETWQIGALPTDANVKIRFETNHYPFGDFKMRLSICFDDNKEGIGFVFRDELAFTIEFSRLLNMDILISDNEVNPYSWWLIAPSNNHNPKAVYQIPNEEDYLFLSKNTDTNFTS
jgi:hypothetical protein